MIDDKLHAAIENALITCARADQILDGIGDHTTNDDLPPWQAAHVWIFRAMCLLIDSLEGVEEVTFSDDERAPIAKTQQPYTHLSNRYGAMVDRYRDLAQDHGG